MDYDLIQVQKTEPICDCEIRDTWDNTCYISIATGVKSAALDNHLFCDANL